MQFSACEKRRKKKLSNESDREKVSRPKNIRQQSLKNKIINDDEIIAGILRKIEKKKVKKKAHKN